jgi:hypothetical protein
VAYKKQTDTLTLPQKVKVLQKLFDFGCKTEKDLQALSMESILQIDGITIQDMTVIMTLQKQVKAHTLFSYLGGGDSEQNRNDE